MHGLKTPAFLGLRSSSRPASPAPNVSPPAMTPLAAPTPGLLAPTPLDINVPASPIDGTKDTKDSLPLRRPLGKLHLSAAFRRASPSPTPIPTAGMDKTTTGTGSSYLDALALKLSEAAGKAIASPTPAHNSDGLLLNGRRPLPLGRGKALGQLIVSEMNAAALNGNDLLRASLRALHRPLNVLLSNISGLLAPLVGAAPTNVLVPSSGWVGNGAAQAHALGLVCMVGELLEALEGLPGDCNKVGGEGLRSIKEGLEGVIKRVVNPVFAAVRTELGTLVDALEAAPEPCAAGAGKNKALVLVDQPAVVALQNAMPCAMRVLARVGAVPGPVVRGALAACDIAIVWRAMVALAHRRVSEPAAAPTGAVTGSPTKTSSGSFLGKSHALGKASSGGAAPAAKSQTLGKTPSLGALGASSVPASLTKRLTPPNTPPAGRFGLLLPPSRPSSPPGVLSPSAQLAHDARVVVGLLDALPKPAGEDAREAVAEAFDALRAFAELLALLSASHIDRQAIIDLVDGESADEGAGQEEREELPALIVLPALLRGKSVATLLNIPEVEYRERCLGGFGRAEASEELVAKAVLRVWGNAGVGVEGEWVKGWLEEPDRVEEYVLWSGPNVMRLWFFEGVIM
ncbi:hypothetical protein FRC06_004313 [Ceratobasidium sp. 370]|nr:hypothetical protein FRC06_004313 [Ceratobasidium sp. 370]